MAATNIKNQTQSQIGESPQASICLLLLWKGSAEDAQAGVIGLDGGVFYSLNL